MARAVSRDSFNELKNYLGVYLQQGRPMLDSDWNENQDIAVSFMRRVIRESLGDGSPNRGFAIDSVLPAADPRSMFAFLFAPLLFLLNFPGPGLDEFGSLQGFQLSSAQGLLRIAREGYGGKSFLRLSGHPGTVTVRKTLPGSVDLSGFEIATFRYRISHPTAGVIKFFVEDDTGARSVWRFPNAGSAADVWLSGYALPLATASVFERSRLNWSMWRVRRGRRTATRWSSTPAPERYSNLIGGLCQWTAVRRLTPAWSDCFGKDECSPYRLALRGSRTRLCSRPQVRLAVSVFIGSGSPRPGFNPRAPRSSCR